MQSTRVRPKKKLAYKLNAIECPTCKTNIIPANSLQVQCFLCQKKIPVCCNCKQVNCNCKTAAIDGIQIHLSLAASNGHTERKPVHGPATCADSFKTLFALAGAVAFQSILTDCLKYRPAINRKQLSTDEILAIALLTNKIQSTNDTEKVYNFYHWLNNVLRTSAHLPSGLYSYLTYLNQGLQKLDDYVGTVYRGIPQLEIGGFVRDNYTVGRKVQWVSYSSATKSLDVAKTFAGQHGIIFCITNASGKLLREYSPRKQEKEIVLLPNTEFFVLSPQFYFTDGYFHVNLMQVQKDSNLLKY